VEDFSSKENIVIFTTAPTGHGHIRVADAIKDGLPDNVQVEELGIVNVNASKIHAFGSRITFLQKITEFYQTNPVAEYIISSLYKIKLHSISENVKKNFKEIRLKHPGPKWLIISITMDLLTTSNTVKLPLQRNSA
jgi:archaellum biogenesis ATPase FlaH